MRRCLCLLLLAGLMSLIGCAGSVPREGERTAARPAPPAAESGRRDSVSGQNRSEGAEPEIKVHPDVQALRAAYVDGAYEDVIQRARKVRERELDPSGRIQVNVLLGRAEQARGRHDAAIEALRRARVTDSEEEASLTAIDRALGESYAALYQWAQAASAFRRVLEAQPEDQAVRQALAEVYRRSRQWRRAEQQYAQLVQADSSNGRWWARLAHSELQRNATTQALRHFAEAHRRLPQSADIALSLSRLYRSTGRLAAARRVVDSTLSHQRGDPRLWRRRADLAFEQDDLDTARRAYSRTLALGDSSATVHRRIGLIDIQRQQYARALPSLRRSFRRDSTHTRTTLYLGIAYLRLDSLRRAARHLQRTIDREAEGPITRALERLGTAQSRRGHVEEAVRAYKTALRLRPDRSTVYFHLAVAYDEHYRDKAPAARYYRRFLEVSDASLPELRRYARSRLKALRPTLHMQQKSRPTDTGPGG